MPFERAADLESEAALARLFASERDLDFESERDLDFERDLEADLASEAALASDLESDFPRARALVRAAEAASDLLCERERCLLV